MIEKLSFSTYPGRGGGLRSVGSEADRGAYSSPPCGSLYLSPTCRRSIVAVAILRDVRLTRISFE